MNYSSLRRAVLTVALLAPLTAHAAIEIVLDQSEDNRFPIGVANIQEGAGFAGSSDILKKIPDVIRNDLKLSGYFYVIAPSGYKDHSATMSTDDIPFDKWTMIGARGIVKGLATTDGGRTTVQLRLFDSATKQMQMGKQYTFDRNDWRQIAHRFSDEIMRASTGKKGPFTTRIAYTYMSKTNKKKRWKQIAVMDMDGANQSRITKDNSYNLGPAWGPDGRHVVFTSYVGGFPDIYSIDLETGQRTQLTSNQSTNTTPAYSPDGSYIAFSSGQGSDMDIYLMNNIGMDQHAFAPAFGADLAPAFSPDGHEIIFASERGGKLNLYRKSVSGAGAAIRVTFSGSENDSPDWSPDGTKVVFCRFQGGVYQVITINPDGSNAHQLTQFGSNEHPRWSPDSRYITYHSTIKGKGEIYIMRYDGANKTSLTKGKDATLPAWGPWPKDYFEDSTPTPEDAAE